MNDNENFLKQKDEKDQTKKVRKPKAKVETVIEEVQKVEAEEIAQTDVIIFENIENALEAKNVTEEILKAMEEDFMVLKISDINDKENYKLIDEKRKMCKKTRSLTKDICEEGRAHLLVQQKAWIKKEKDIVSRIQAVEDHLEAELKKVDDEKERIKAEKELADQLRMQQRTAKLLSLGMELKGDNYILGSIVINALHVKIYTDFDFGAAIAEAQAEHERQMVIKAEEDAKLAALQEQQIKEREQLDKEKAEFEAKQRKAAEEEEERQKKIKAEQDKLEAEKKALAESKIKARASQLYAQGMAFNGTDHVFGTYVVSGELIKNLSDTEWDQKITTEIIPELATRKAKIEDDRLAKIEKDKQDAIEADRKKRAEEEIAKAKKEADEKAKADEVKRKALEDEARIAALRPDEEKYLEFKNSFENIPEPAYVTEEYKKFSGECKEVIRKMVIHFEKTKPK